MIAAPRPLWLDYGKVSFTILGVNSPGQSDSHYGGIGRFYRFLPAARVGRGRPVTEPRLELRLDLPLVQMRVQQVVQRVPYPCLARHLQQRRGQYGPGLVVR